MNRLILNQSEDDLVQIPIDGTLDLHMFSPKEVPDLLDEYINVCREKGIYELKIIHGKGKGILRDKVHSVLKKHPHVDNFHLDTGPSGWGASIAYLKINPELTSVQNS